jgi:hypothetical protein
LRPITKNKDWARAFLIFASYEDGEMGGVAAMDDIIYAGPDPKKVIPSDLDRLKRLGWEAAHEFGCFYKLT